MTSVMPVQEVPTLDPADEKRIDRLLAKARTALVLEHPFIDRKSTRLNSSH